MKTALITGITGQDGSYLAELLLEEGYNVYGFIRRVALQDPEDRMKRWAPALDIVERITWIPGILEDYGSVFECIDQARGSSVAGSELEIYHLAAQSQVQESFDDPSGTFKTNAQGTLNVLQAMRNLAPWGKMYFAGSSEQFGNVDEICHEETPFDPVSPYAVTKAAGYQLCGIYRQAYGLHISRGIAFNHESPRRSDEFVTRKITRTLARIKLGSKEKLRLGNVNSARDWGHADEYVRAMWAMLQDDKPGDYVIATGRTHTVIDFVTEACHALQLGGDPRQFVDYDENLERTVELKRLRADPSRIYDKLRWKAVTPFCDLVGEMCVADLRREQSKVYI